MTLVDESDLRRAFRAELKALPAMNPAQVKFAPEGETFDPPAVAGPSARPALWVREQLRPLNESRNAAGLVQSSGHVIYGVYRQVGQDIEEAEAVARAIAERFEAGQNITVNADGVHIDHCDRGPWIEDSQLRGWTFKAVTLLWRVHTLASI